MKDVVRANTGSSDPRFPKGVPDIKGSAKVNKQGVMDIGYCLVNPV